MIFPCFLVLPLESLCRRGCNVFFHFLLKSILGGWNLEKSKSFFSSKVLVRSFRGKFSLIFKASSHSSLGQVDALKVGTDTLDTPLL